MSLCQDDAAGGIACVEAFYAIHKPAQYAKIARLMNYQDIITIEVGKRN